MTKITDKRIKNLIIGMLCLLAFFLFDWLTKYFFFKDLGPLDGTSTTHDWKVLAIRPLKHDRTTFLSFLNVELPLWAMSLMDFVVLSIFVVFFFFVKSRRTIIFVSIVIAGILGNAADRLVTDGNYVRDIFYTPWLDRGTFNAADLFIIVGSISLAISFIISQFTNAKETKKKIAE